jgi:hypothetical protein
VAKYISATKKENAVMKYAHILTPSKTHGGFHPLCCALRDEPFEDAKLTVGSTYASHHVPDLVVISMGTDRAINFGNSALTSLQKSKISKFGIFTTIDGMRRFIQGGLPDILGDRMKFAIIEGLAPVPTRWPRDIHVVRIADPLTSTCLCIVRKEFLTYIGPERAAEPEAEAPKPKRAATG